MIGVQIGREEIKDIMFARIGSGLEPSSTLREVAWGNIIDVAANLA